MGNFVEVSKEGIKNYTLFSKNAIKQVISLQAILPMYTFIAEDKYKSKQVFLDSGNNLLSSAGVILSKTTEKNKAYFKVEMEQLRNSTSSILKRSEKVYIHNVGVKDNVKDHLFFLANGIKAMFSTQFTIDLDNVLKMIVPKIELKTKRSIFKVFSGNGFKAELIFDEIDVRNFESRRGTSLQTLTVKQTSAIQNTQFEEFTNKLEKFCKEIIPTEDTKFEIVKRMTR